MSGPTGSAASSVILPPKGVARNYTQAAGSLVTLPGTSNNGDYFTLSSSHIPVLSYYNAAGTLQWSFDTTHISPSARLIGLFWDEVDSRIYTLELDSYTGSAATLGWLNITTGVWTQLGSGITGLTPLFWTGQQSTWHYVCGNVFYRDTHGTGDFTLRGGNGGASSTGVNEVVIPASGTGAVTEIVDSVLVGGAKTKPALGARQSVAYKSADGVLCGSFFKRLSTSSIYSNGFWIGRTGLANARIPDEVSGYYGTQPGFCGFGVINWGQDTLVMASLGTHSISPSYLDPYGNRVFDQTDFDRWLKEVAIAYGVF